MMDLIATDTAAAILKMQESGELELLVAAIVADNEHSSAELQEVLDFIASVVELPNVTKNVSLN